ncbi:histidine phosphatase family protein [Actinopolymorpha sp. B17G11]|uniref:histidine phosphatase family protein n=1 Tax=unclassified Actinopolymorpha TaxID=2627063 RepID=UPI0032D91C3B
MPSAAAVRILYVRHGENLANTLHQLSHKVVDHPLTDHGRDQAEQLARRLADQSWLYDAEIVSSPSRRAQETAQVIAAKLDLSIGTDERLREIDVGALDGRSDQEAWDVYAEVHRRWAAGEWSRRFPDGENLRNLANRLRAALLGAATTVGQRPATQGGRDTPVVLVVGHGGGFRAALPYLVKNVADAYPHDDMANCAVTYLRAIPASRPSVIHLEEWGVPCAELHRLRVPD